MNIQGLTPRLPNLQGSVPYGGKSGSTQHSEDASIDQAYCPTPPSSPISPMTMSSGTRDFALQMMIEKLKNDMDQKLNVQNDKFEKKLKKQKKNFKVQLNQQKQELSSLKKINKEHLAKIDQLSQDKLKLQEENQNLVNKNEELQKTIDQQNETIKDLNGRLKNLEKPVGAVGAYPETDFEIIHNPGTSIQAGDKRENYHHHQAKTFKKVKRVRDQVKKDPPLVPEPLNNRNCCCIC